MAGYDPSQPRDKDGKWTNTGAGAVAAARAAAGLPAVSQAAEEACTRFSRVYHRAPVEHCEIIDPSTGDVIWDGVGNEYSVSLDDYMLGVNYNEYPPPEGLILIHNHPKPIPQSPKDLQLAADIRLGQIRVALWGWDGLEEHVVKMNDRSIDLLASTPLWRIEKQMTSYAAQLKSAWLDWNPHADPIYLPEDVRLDITTRVMQYMSREYGFEYEVLKK